MSSIFRYTAPGVIAVVQLNGFVGLSFVPDRNGEGHTAVIQHRDGFTKVSIPTDAGRQTFADAIADALDAAEAATGQPVEPKGIN